MSSNKIPKQVNVLLLDDFSALACASAIEPLIACNKISGDSLYSITYMGSEQHALSNTGLRAKSLSLSEISIDTTGLDSHGILMICGGSPADFHDDSSKTNFVKKFAPKHQLVIGIGTGSYLLAKAGLLTHRKASVHWWGLEQLRSEFRSIHFSSDLFSIDGSIATCRGGSSAFDLTLALIAQEHGQELVEAVTQFFLRERIGFSKLAANRIPLSPQIEQECPKISTAIQLMEANIEEPLSTEQLADQVNISKRQLERLFKQHLDSAPSRYYLMIRLEQARLSLLDTNDTITNIALACGFSSTAHFSSSYRNLYGLTPTEERTLQNTDPIV